MVLITSIAPYLELLLHTHTQKNLYILTLNFMVTDLNEFLLLISKGACSDTQMMEGKRRGEEMKRSNGPCFRHSSFSFHLNLCFTLCLSTSPDRQVLYNPIGITPSLWVYQGQFTLALSLWITYRVQIKHCKSLELT